MTDDERRAIEADCERLIKRYVNLNDAQDWPAVAALYAEDARFARPSQPGVFVEGREAILESFLARAARAQRHVIANVVVEVEDADHASAFSVIVLYQGDPTPAGELPAMSANSPLVGTFSDRLVRTRDGWRFAERVGGLDFKTVTEPTLLSGGNPQIAKADGDAPVQAYIAAMPGWKSGLGRRLDALIERAVPGVRKAVKWNSPFYGVEGQGWFLSYHCFTRYVKVTFFTGGSLRPLPPGKSKNDGVRTLDIREDDPLDEAQLADWVRQAAAIPGWMA